jgi:hypothetical protein
LSQGNSWNDNYSNDDIKQNLKEKIKLWPPVGLREKSQKVRGRRGELGKS